MSKHTPGYEVTKDGKVYSVDSNWRGYGRRELVQTLNSYGYPSVRLNICGKRKRIAVHVLVAEKYLGPKPSEIHQVRHLDGNRQNPFHKNLCWGTAAENAADRDYHGKTSKGEHHSRCIRRGISLSTSKYFKPATQGECHCP